MTEKELRRYYNMFTDCWRFFRKYSNLQDNDKYWDNVVSETHKITKKYEKCKLITNLVLASLTELEKLAKEKKTIDDKCVKC